MTINEAIQVLDDRCEGNELSEDAFLLVVPILEAAANVDKEKAMSSLFAEYSDWIKSVYELIDSLPDRGDK